jgi:hypothetical protein
MTITKSVSPKPGNIGLADVTDDRLRHDRFVSVGLITSSAFLCVFSWLVVWLNKGRLSVYYGIPPGLCLERMLAQHQPFQLTNCMGLAIVL